MLLGNNPIFESFSNLLLKENKLKANLVGSMREFRKNEIFYDFKYLNHIFFPSMSDIFTAVHKWNHPKSIKSMKPEILL